MKKGAKPELTQAWWSKNKAKTLGTTGLGNALKTYEVAADRLDFDRMLKALNAVEAKVIYAARACNPKRHAGTLAALGKKYPALIQATRKEILKRKTEYEQRRVPPKQKVGRQVVIWKRDVATEVKKVYNPPWLRDFTGFKVALKVNNDILAVLKKEKDLATPAFMVEDAQRLCALTVEKIVALIKNHETDVTDMPEVEALKLRKQLDKDIGAQVRQLALGVAKIPPARWRKFVAQKAQYRAYKVKAGCDLAIGVLGTGLSGLAIASAVPTGGAGLVLGLINGVRALTALAGKCRDLWLKAESVEKGLVSDLQALKSAYLNTLGQAKKSMPAKEITMSVVKGLLNTDAPFVATLPKCNKNYKLWDNKVAGLAVSGRALTRQFMEVLEAVNRLEKEMEKAMRKSKRKSKRKEAGKLLDQVRKIRRHLSEAFDNAAAMNARVKKAEETQPALKSLLEQLTAQNPDYAKVFDRAFHFAVNVGLAGASAGVGFDNADKALKHVNASVQLTRKLATELKKQVEIEANK